jgi:hypothetical protein
MCEPAPSEAARRRRRAHSHALSIPCCAGRRSEGRLLLPGRRRTVRLQRAVFCPACACCPGIPALVVRMPSAHHRWCSRAGTSPAPCLSTWSRASCRTCSRPCLASSTKRTSTGIPRAAAPATTGCATGCTPGCTRPGSYGGVLRVTRPVLLPSGCTQSPRPALSRTRLARPEPHPRYYKQQGTQRDISIRLRLAPSPLAMSGCRLHDRQFGAGGDSGDDRQRGRRCVGFGRIAPHAHPWRRADWHYNAGGGGGRDGSA